MTVIKGIINRGLESIRGSKVKICIVEVIAMFLAARMFIYTGYVRYSPEREAEAFAVKLLNADYESIYHDLNVSGEEDEFINKEAFINVQNKARTKNLKDCQVEKQSVGSGFVEKFIVGKAAANRNRSNDYVSIAFTDQEGETYQNGVQMNQSDSKKFFLFSDWKPDLSDYIVHNFSISVQKGAAVTVGGVTVPEEYSMEEDYGNIRYVIPQIFKGYYEVTVVKEGMEDLNMIVNTVDGHCSAEVMELKPKIIQKAISQAADDLKKLYSAAFENKETSKLKGISILPESEDEVKNEYSYLAEQIQYNNKTSLIIEEILPEAYYYPENGMIFVEVNLDYEYSGLNEYRYWDENETYNGSNNAIFVYVLDGSNLMLNSFSGLSLY